MASVMLFVWLFAVFTSWANACLVQPSAATPDLRAHHERFETGTDHDPAHHAAAGAGTTQAPDPAQEACASFCAAEQGIVAKAQPWQADSGVQPCVLAMAGFDGWPALTHGRADPRWRPLAAPPPPGPPVAIAFLRLTL